MPRREEDKEIQKLLDEIHAEEALVQLSPWTLTLDDMLNWNQTKLDWDSGKRNYGLTEIFDADNPQKLNEASLGHFYSSFLDSKSESFAIFPDRARVEIKRNKEKIIHLLHQFDDNNQWDLMAHSNTYEPGGENRRITQKYWFIINIKLTNLIDTVKDFEKCSFLYLGPETGGNLKYYEDSVTVADVGAFHPNKIAQFYSKIASRPVVFESKISGWFGGCASLHHGIKEVPGIRKPRRLITKTVKG